MQRKKATKTVKKASKKGLSRSKYLHILNAGVENRSLFNTKEDFDRFEAYLYLLNSTESPRVANLFAAGREANVFETGRGEKLVAIAAYSFVPKEFHILATPLVEGGIGKFMQKVQTAYTMYFNNKHARSGGIFRSGYRSEAATSDDHLKYLFARTHAAAAALFDEQWEDAHAAEQESLFWKSSQYRYSSFSEYVNGNFVICSPEHFPAYIAQAKKGNAPRIWSWYRNARM